MLLATNSILNVTNIRTVFQLIQMIAPTVTISQLITIACRALLPIQSMHGCKKKLLAKKFGLKDEDYIELKAESGC